nr:MAG TPA: cytokine receptor common subunit [Caudoviricetes sp.]
MMVALLFIIVLLIILVPFCLYVRHHRMKDLHVNLSLFKGIEFKCSFYKR